MSEQTWPLSKLWMFVWNPLKERSCLFFSSVCLKTEGTLHDPLYKRLAFLLVVWQPGALLTASPGPTWRWSSIWPHLCFLFAGVSCLPGGLKVPDSAGAFHYEESGNLSTVTSNRFVHWWASLSLLMGVGGGCLYRGVSLWSSPSHWLYLRTGTIVTSSIENDLL